jgi:Cu/Ag efflux pump CusA
MRMLVLAALIACSGRSGAPTPSADLSESQRLPADTVQIVVEHAFDALELERSATRPIEISMTGVTGATGIHSVTQHGRSVITIDLDGVDLWAARQEIMTRLRDVALPTGMTADLGPPTTAHGVIARYVVRGDRLPGTRLRALADWVIRPKLLTVPGIADVSTCGTGAEQVQIALDPKLLEAAGLAFGDVKAALEWSSSNVEIKAGAAGGFVVRGTSLTDDALSAVVVKTINGAPVRVADLAQRQRGPEPHTCFVADSQGADLLEVAVWALAGSMSGPDPAALASVFDEIRRALPLGVSIERVQDSAEATVVLSAESIVHQIRAVMGAGVPGALVEIGRRDGGYDTDLPRRARVRGGDVATARAAAAQLAEKLGTTWYADQPTVRIRIAGPELEQLGKFAEQIAVGLDVVERVGIDVEPAMRVTPDRAAMARLDVAAGDVEDAVAALGAVEVGYLYDDETPRVPIVLSIAGPIDSLTLRDASGQRLVPLLSVATVTTEQVPTVILHDRGSRYVELRIRTNDLAALRAKLATVALPAGYTADLL